MGFKWFVATGTTIGVIRQDYCAAGGAAMLSNGSGISTSSGATTSASGCKLQSLRNCLGSISVPFTASGVPKTGQFPCQLNIFVLLCPRDKNGSNYLNLLEKSLRDGQHWPISKIRVC